MAAPMYIQACCPAIHLVEAFLQPIPIVTKPYVPPTTPAGLTFEETEIWLEQKRDEKRTTHLTYYGDGDDAQPRQLPLPDTHPECPEQWTSEEWNKRLVLGDSKIHLFSTTGKRKKKCFILKVSRDKNHEDKWIYEEFDPHSKWPQGSQLDSHSTQLVFNLMTQQQEAKKGMAVP